MNKGMETGSENEQSQRHRRIVLVKECVDVWSIQKTRSILMKFRKFELCTLKNQSLEHSRIRSVFWLAARQFSNTIK